MSIIWFFVYLHLGCMDQVRRMSTIIPKYLFFFLVNCVITYKLLIKVVFS
jgi:hypothetical protein